MNANERIYLVVCAQILVSQDIATTISDFDPGARVILAGDMASAVEQADGRISMAFVEPALWSEHHAQGVLSDTMIVMLGANIVAPEIAHSCRLELPFTTEHIMALLARHPFAQPL